MASALPVRVREGSGDHTLVLLHGRGADEDDLFGLFDVLDPGRLLRGVTLGGPLRLPPGGKHWYVVPQVGFPDPVTFTETYGLLQRTLDEEVGVDWARTVVGGFSQGTVMSYALGLGPGRPAPEGILAMSGFVPTVEGWSPSVPDGLPVLITHGIQDPVMDIHFARDAKALLEAGGAQVEYHETESRHAIDPRGIPDIARWLRTTTSD